jgi:putative membrane protein
MSTHKLTAFLVHWAATALSLWAATRIFSGLHFQDGEALLVSALVLGLANAVVKPLLIVLTLPLTVLTLGFFLLVLNALVLQLVAGVVNGFAIDGFGTALWASLFISFLSTFIAGLVPGSAAKVQVHWRHGGDDDGRGGPGRH